MLCLTLALLKIEKKEKMLRAERCPTGCELGCWATQSPPVRLEDVLGTKSSRGIEHREEGPKMKAKPKPQEVTKNHCGLLLGFCYITNSLSLVNPPNLKFL